MRRPALSRGLTWSLVGTSWFTRRRSEASVPMKAASSRGGRRAEAGSEGSACAPVAGWGESAAADLRPRPASSAPSILGRAGCWLCLAGASFPERIPVQVGGRAAAAFASSGKLRMFRGLLSQRCASTGGVRLLSRSVALWVAWHGPDSSLSPLALVGALDIGTPCRALLTVRDAGL
jgi:hypothetical protein